MMEKMPQVDPSRFPYRAPDWKQIDEHAGGFRTGEKCIYSGVLPLDEVMVIGWDPELFGEFGKLAGMDCRYRRTLVPVIEEGKRGLVIWWVAPHQLKRKGEE